MNSFGSSLWRQRFAIFLAAVGLGLAYNAISPHGVGAPAASGHDPSPLITVWPEVKALMAAKRIVLVDARNTGVFEAAHIPGAVSLPFAELAGRIGPFMSRYAKTQPIVVYCGDAECPVSHAEGVALLEQYGFGDIREMPGGYAEWRVAEPGVPPAQGD